VTRCAWWSGEQRGFLSIPASQDFAAFSKQSSPACNDFGEIREGTALSADVN
jgi:hypothetical protein